ncbi:MAG: hypothetical protein HYU64_17250 [Armatimonadetes bacterium]|nr:hypothetical protein [Armatimonadota bacterium]
MRIILVTIILGIAMTSPSIAKNIYVIYDTTERKKTASDERDCIIGISITDGVHVNYYFREDLYGARTPVAKSLFFQNSWKRKLTPQEKSDLSAKLLKANVFSLKSDPESKSKGYSADLLVQIGTKESRFFFYTPPNSPTRKAVHKIMLELARKTEIDQPQQRNTSTTITEGDFQPARKVQLSEVLANPDKYHGKRISVIGYYHGEFEGSSLSVNEKASRDNDLKRSVWRSGPSTFADKSAIKDKNNAWLRVEGVFLRGPGGHMSLWPGEIARLTRVEPASKP